MYINNYEDYMNDKTKQINIRMTMKDYDLLNKQRKILQMSQVDFVSHIINNGINQVIEVSNEELQNNMKTIERIINQVGVNINQIAKMLNQGKTPDVNPTLEALNKNILILIGKMDKLKKERITTKEDI
ncbi:plasmid mobilization relaxosome protein MobC [Pseudomonas aeruginosa]|nr:plasmid mobilization relaxosome protein MobC [Pseudomonas aeruginosa]